MAFSVPDLWPSVWSSDVRFNKKLQMPTCIDLAAVFKEMFKFSDIDECREANACGANSLCNNVPGNYSCSCQEGYAGDPYTGVSTLTGFHVTEFFVLWIKQIQLLLAKSHQLKHGHRSVHLIIWYFGRQNIFSKHLNWMFVYFLQPSTLTCFSVWTSMSVWATPVEPEQSVSTSTEGSSASVLQVSRFT